MSAAPDTDPLRDEQSGDGFGPEAWGVLVNTLLVLLALTVAAAGPVGSWVAPVLLVGAGAGAIGILHWIRVRRLRRRAAARIDALRTEKEEAETALQAATERAEKLEAMSAAKSQFLEEMSHAFRRPLTLTVGPIDTVLEGRAGTLSEEARTQLHVAERNGTRLLWLVNQLLDLAELETGNMDLAPTEADLPAFVARRLRTFEDLAERRGVTLDFESTLNDPTVWFDSSKMETILANLLSNAFRAAEEGGTIRVAVCPVPAEREDATSPSEPAGDLELLVEHAGAPLSAEWGANSIEWPLEDGRHREPGGVSASAGLRLVDELVDLHGGHLWTNRTGETVRYAVRLPRRPPGPDATGRDEAERNMESRVPGDGAHRSVLALSREILSSEPAATNGEVSTETPRVPDPPSGDLRPGNEAQLYRGSHAGNGTAPDAEEDRTTVLVIDDNSVICTLVRAHLEPEYRVEEAHDGAEGYTLARRLLPDLVITDVMMPEVDGFELCRKIKEDPDIDHVPVVFLTARADLEDKVEGFDTGADAYLTKPFEPEELIARVENLIATRQALQESFRANGGDGTDSGTSAPRAHGLENAEEALPPTAANASLKEQIEEAIAEHLTDPEFGVSELASATALSASQLRRRTNEIYDRPPVQLIRRRRLEAGAQLLRERTDATIGEVAYAVGFNSQSYFSRSFRDEFGTSPSQYRSGGVAA